MTVLWYFLYLHQKILLHFLTTPPPPRLLVFEKVSGFHVVPYLSVSLLLIEVDNLILSFLAVSDSCADALKSRPSGLDNQDTIPSDLMFNIKFEDTSLPIKCSGWYSNQIE